MTATPRCPRSPHRPGACGCCWVGSTARPSRCCWGRRPAEAAQPPADPTHGGFDASAAVELSLSPAQIEDYEHSARAVAKAAVAHSAVLAQHAPCIEGGLDPDLCYAQVVETLGPLLWRRPIEADELEALVTFGRAVRLDAGFGLGLEFVLATMLQAPSFLYVVEVGEPDDASEHRVLRPRELATRMALLLLGHTPDAELMALADAGGLDDDAGIREAAWAMLQQPRARTAVADYFDQLFRLRDLPTTGKIAEVYPQFDERLATAMRQETQRLIEHVVFDEDIDLLSVLDADYTFVNADLAELYGIEPPDTPWAQVPVPQDQGRRGLLTHPSFLSLFAQPARASPTRRGLFVQQMLLCTEIMPPPPRVNPELPELDPDLTFREQLEAHTADAACAGCHSLMDPVGFAFGHFDGIGAHHPTEDGKPIDATGQVGGLGSFDGPAELAALLRQDPRVSQCIVRNLYRGTLGVAETIEQAEGIDQLV
ncbi:MAG: DUF1592 domain-containing protein, partial [Deltaproteobacteria bacterium]|nr:DUF1592 domain-containing protein [Deltaproteobacteria bacterium]